MIDDDSYTAASIRILRDDEAGERFLFVQIEQLARKYPAVPREFIARLIEAVTVTGTPLEPIEKRYLVGDRSIPKVPEVEQALLHILDQQRQSKAER